ncbi:MAG: hypothetical protein IJQ11_14795 [Bacteroidales bacterium]|nr:hypothetical protein [Bacteroidales bacterium]
MNISICNAKRTTCLLFYRIANPYIPQQLDCKSSRTGVEGNTKNPATQAFAQVAKMCPSVGTVLKKAKPLNKLRPDKCGSPFAVRELAFLTTSFLSQGAIVSFFSERRNRKALHHHGEGFPEKNEKNVCSLMVTPLISAQNGTC